MKDLIIECAQKYINASKYNYKFILGNKKRIEIHIDMRCSKDEFTHITGLDHLKDIKEIGGHNIKKKRSFIKDIVNGKINIDNLTNSFYFNKPIKGTYNYETKKPYTIYERIDCLKDMFYILDNAYKGSFYKWNCNNSCKILNGKNIGKSFIEADYMLCIPNLFRYNKYQKIYMFMYQENKFNNDDPVKLKIHSAFPDCVDITKNQQKYTILYEAKFNTKIGTLEELYVSSHVKNNKNS